MEQNQFLRHVSTRESREVSTMFGTKKSKQTTMPSEDDYETYEHKRVAEFHPHCFIQQLALAEAKQFDEVYAMAHEPAHGEEE